MLAVLAVLLVIMWFLGMLNTATIGSYLPILLVVALVIFAVRLITGRHAY